MESALLVLAVSIFILLYLNSRGKESESDQGSDSQGSETIGDVYRISEDVRREMDEASNEYLRRLREYRRR